MKREPLWPLWFVFIAIIYLLHTLISDQQALNKRLYKLEHPDAGAHP